MGRKSSEKAKQKKQARVQARAAAATTAVARGDGTGRFETVLVACALVGLAFSSLLYADYQSPGSGLCSVVGGGCDAVRMSAYSSIAGISVPTLGILYFLALLAAALLPALRPVLTPLALAGGIAGLTFIGLQGLVIGAWCPFCLVVDVSAITAAAAAVRIHGRPAAPLTFDRFAKVGALAIVALALVGLGGGGDGPTESPVAGSTSEPLPAFVAELQKEAPITVVEFLDFQCPACNFQHRVFSEALSRVDYDVEMVYLHAPLPQHPYAEDAARAYLCAADQGRGPEMADALFLSAAPTPEQVQQFATGLDLDTEAFGRCLISAATQERIELDAARANQAGLRSLPTFWIGNQKFVGTQEIDVVLEALDRLAYRAGGETS